MKVVCAYCKKVILDGHEPTSHGICPKCLKRELKRVEEAWESEERRKEESTKTDIT